MSWHTIDVEGRKMYERDGVRVNSTEQIDIIEKAERDVSEARKARQPAWMRESEEEPDVELEPLGTTARIVVLSIMAVLILIILIFSK